MKPHRGVLILVLGILGITTCQLLGIAAWVMGNQDLAEMNAGVMDPEGRQMTQIGKVCGIISLVLMAVSFLMVFVWLAFVVAMSAAG